MDFVSGALPNVMFLVGIIAIGIGLGIEFKIVEVKGQLGKGSRAAAFGIGTVLIATSVYIYTRPPHTTVAPVAAAPNVVQAAMLPTGVPATAIPAAAVPPMALPATAQPATNAAPVATATPKSALSTTVVAPDLRGSAPKDAERQLNALGLRLGANRDSCAALGVAARDIAKVKHGQITCQSPAPKSAVAPGTPIDYVLDGKGK